MTTYFQDFIRDDGSPVTVEYSTTGGEPNFDYPGHICDGGGSGPEICIVESWPNTPAYERLVEIEMRWKWSSQRWRRAIGLFWRFRVWLASGRKLTDAEYGRMEAWLAEHHVEEPYEPEY